MNEQSIVNILYILMGGFFWYKIEKLSQKGERREMVTICDYCLKLCELGKDARKLDDNVICRECEESETSDNG